MPKNRVIKGDLYAIITIASVEKAKAAPKGNRRDFYDGHDRIPGMLKLYVHTYCT